MATFYIDFAAGADTNTSTQAQSQSTPWKHAPGMDGATSNANAYAVQTGDVFVLKGGSTWTTSSTVNDLWTLPHSSITIQGGQQLGTPWGSGFPIIDATGSTGTRSCIASTGKNTITIDGIKVVNSVLSSDGSGAGISGFSDSGNWEVKNCSFDNCGQSSFQYSPVSGSSLLFHHNTTSNCGRIFMPVDAAVTFDNVQIYNNIILGPGTWPANSYHADGVIIGSASNTDPSPFTNIQIYNNKFSGDWSQGATAIIYLNNGSGNSGWTVGGGYHAKIYNNQMCIDSNGVISPGFLCIFNGWRDVQVYNNTMNAVTSGGNNPPYVATGIAIQSCTTSAAIVVKNNIISGALYGIAGTDAGFTIGAGLTADYNLYETTGGNQYMQLSPSGVVTYNSLAAMQGIGAEAHGQVVASLSSIKFTTLPNGTSGVGSWPLTLGSPAIDTGVDLSATLPALATDIIGTARPQGSAWDLGAYEFIGGGGSGGSALSGKISLSGKVTIK